MTLREKRVLFSNSLASLIVWFNLEARRLNKKWQLALGEGYVKLTDDADGDYDGPHLKTGGHYTGLANDLLLYDDIDNDGDQDYVTGDHPAWHMLATKWKSWNPEFRWGGDFSKKDYNHFSMLHEGVA